MLPEDMTISSIERNKRSMEVGVVDYSIDHDWWNWKMKWSDGCRLMT